MRFQTNTKGYTMKREKYCGSRGTGEFRPMTFQEAVRLKYGQEIWFVSFIGDARRCRVNGAVKTWKRDATRLAIPMKYGIREWATFTQQDIADGRLLVEI